MRDSYLDSQNRLIAVEELFRARVQHRAVARGVGDENAGRGLLRLPRPYDRLPDISYPLHDRDVVVTACGRICMHHKRIKG
jgi:hypothetical protein